MRNYRTGLVSWLFVLLCCLCSAAQAAPQTGWYWNPNESGRGFFVESHDGVTFIGAYLYDTDGHAMWLVAAGPNADSYNFAGDLYNKSGGQTLFGAYVPPGPANIVGTLSVHFSDDTHATLTWPGGTVAIERQIYGTGDPLFDLDNGWWWNPDESGSGYSVEVQGTNLFVVGFMYGDDGRPVWYYSAGPMSSSSTYHGDVLQFANGQTMGGAYHPPSAPVKIATLDIEFTAQNEATTTFTDTSGTASVLQTKRAPRSNPWQPQIPKPGRFVFPKSYAASVDLESDFSADTSVDGKLTITSGLIPMIESFTTVPPAFRQYAQDPQDNHGFIASITYAVSGDVFDCTQIGTLNVQLPLTSVQLRVTSFGQYTVTWNTYPAVVPATITCPDPNGGPATTTAVAYPWPGATYTHTARINNLTPGGSYKYGDITDDWAVAYEAGGHADIHIQFFANFFEH